MSSTNNTNIALNCPTTNFSNQNAYYSINNHSKTGNSNSNLELDNLVADDNLTECIEFDRLRKFNNLNVGLNEIECLIYFYEQIFLYGLLHAIYRIYIIYALFYTIYKNIILKKTRGQV